MHVLRHTHHAPLACAALMSVLCVRWYVQPASRQQRAESGTSQRSCGTPPRPHCGRRVSHSRTRRGRIAPRRRLSLVGEPVETFGDAFLSPGVGALTPPRGGASSCVRRRGEIESSKLLRQESSSCLCWLSSFCCGRGGRLLLHLLVPFPSPLLLTPPPAPSRRASDSLVIAP